MWRRSATTRLIVEASRVLHKMVGVLSDLECVMDMRVSGNSTRRVAM